ncbi:PQQ-binding-like beta-propeller repeat protein [bacterium]|nr:PQQ-binding-like beta-propeller repeat protein [bacterium]
MLKLSTLKLRVSIVAVVVTGISAFLVTAHGGDWPTFRGAQRTAVAPDTGLLTSWPEGGPKLLWKSKGTGRGYSSLAIADGRIYTLGDRSSLTDGDNSEYLLCFSREDGSPIWKLKTGNPWDNGAPDWQGSRSTPTVDGDRVYVLTPHGDLVCTGAADGVEKWRKNLKSDFGGRKGDGWGYGESVTVDGDRLICTPGGEKSTMVALNKQTGDLIWSAVRPGDRGAGHASIVVSQVGGTRVYVQTTASGALGVRAEDGKPLWSYGIDQTTAVIPTAIVRGDLVFFSAGYGRGGALLRQVAGANGDVSVDEVYPINKKLANKHGGIVLIGDYLYGDTDDRGTPFCAELMTGNVVWQSRGSGKRSANIVAADGYLYIRYSDGTLALVKATPDGYRESGLLKIPGSDTQPSWSHSVIPDGRLYLREGDTLLCYDLQR